MRVLAVVAALLLSGCAATGGGAGAGLQAGASAPGRASFKPPSSMPSGFCTYPTSFMNPSQTDIVCF
jgi:hypothetical protein